MNAQVIAKAPVNVTNLFLSYDNSHILLSGKPVVNPQFLAGSAVVGRLSVNATRIHACTAGFT
jgi:hypothetical protein